MSKPTRNEAIDRLIPAIRRLLATRPAYNIEHPDGPMRTIDCDAGRLSIRYMAHAVDFRGRPRAIAPYSLDVYFDGAKVLALRWDGIQRKIAVYKAGPWQSSLARAIRHG
jgi:hypothetical protein